MEVRKRLFALSAVVVTLTIVTSADSSVVDLTQLLEGQPYYDESHHDYAKTIRTRQTSLQYLLQCGLEIDPCTSINLDTLNHRAFACPNNPTEKYLLCSAVGSGDIITCPTNEVFSEPVQRCMVTPGVNPVVPDSQELPIGIAVTTNYDYPCTHANIANQLLKHPYESHTQVYILCNDWGTGYLETCAPYYFNQLTSTCVEGPIVGRK